MTEQVEPSPKTEELVRAVSNNHQTPMAPLDLVEEQRPRAKLRIWAILIALYVCEKINGQKGEKPTLTPQARPLRCCAGPNHHRDFDPDHLGAAP